MTAIPMDIASGLIRERIAHEDQCHEYLLRPRRDVARALAQYIRASENENTFKPLASRARLDRAFRIYHSFDNARRLVVLGNI